MTTLTQIEFTVLADYATTKTADGFTFAVYPFQDAHNAAVRKLTEAGLLERSGNRARITDSGLALIPDVIVNPPRVDVEWPTVYGGWRGNGGQLTDLQRLANGGYPVNERKW